MDGDVAEGASVLRGLGDWAGILQILASAIPSLPFGTFFVGAILPSAFCVRSGAASPLASVLVISARILGKKTLLLITAGC